MLNRNYISSVIIDKPISNNSYLNKIPAIKFLLDGNKLKVDSDVTFFVGENGMGKSTLIEAIAVAYGFNPEGGTMNFNFSTKSSHSDLWQNLIIAKKDYASDGFFLRAESFYNVATNIEQLDEQQAPTPKIISSYGGISLHNQSHGESFLSLVKNRFGGNGIYILDEPEAAMSPMKLLVLISEIKRLVNKNSQFIIATHSPILMAYPDAKIYEFNINGIKETNYFDTEHYKISKLFFDNPKHLINKLFSE